MATTTISLPAQETSDAEFRAWGAAVSSALAALGLIKTGDTGQIDWTTVLRPTVASTVAGYEIWRFNDTLQATAPVFIKIEYGSGTTLSALGTWFTVGTATNGAGTITGQVGTRAQCCSSTFNSTVTASYLSGASNRLQWCMNASQNAIGLGWVISVERTKDATGADDSTGIATYLGRASSSTSGTVGNDQVIPFIGVVPANDIQPTIAAPAAASAVAGSDVGVFPHFPVFGKVLNPELGLISYKTADIAALSNISVTLYGVAHNYLTLGNNQAGNSASSRNDLNDSLMMRYE